MCTFFDVHLVSYPYCLICNSFEVKCCSVSTPIVICHVDAAYYGAQARGSGRVDAELCLPIFVEHGWEGSLDTEELFGGEGVAPDRSLWGFTSIKVDFQRLVRLVRPEPKS